MESYLEERRSIENPFHPSHIYPNRPTISPFAKKKKTKTPQREAGPRIIKTTKNKEKQGSYRDVSRHPRQQCLYSHWHY